MKSPEPYVNLHRKTYEALEARARWAEEIAKPALDDAAEHMERARGILRESKGTGGNWGMLDTAKQREALAAYPQPVKQQQP